ncbi:hypothetical protein Tco_1232897 [Tanacetum coccineum]
MFRRCSAMCLGTPVISVGFQAKMSKLCWSSPNNLLRPSSVRVEPIITVCSGYSEFIAILTLSSIIGLVADKVSSAVDETACNFLTPGLPIIPLYEDDDLTTMKFIQAEAECSSSPLLINNCICLIGHIISLLNPIKGVVAGPPSTYIRCT